MPTQIARDAPCMAGPTGYCANGKHQQCPYRPGGACGGGITLPEGFLTFPPGKRWTGAAVLPDNLDRGPAVAAIIRPSHRYRCSCDCHDVTLNPAVTGGQLELFGALS